MKHQQILEFASTIYTASKNESYKKISNKRATIEVNDALRKFIDILKKNPGYEGRGGRIIT